jgi:hypothetical protein
MAGMLNAKWNGGMMERWKNGAMMDDLLSQHSILPFFQYSILLSFSYQPSRRRRNTSSSRPMRSPQIRMIRHWRVFGIQSLRRCVQ